MADDKPRLLDVAGGDPAVDRRLRQSLTQMRGASDDPAFGRVLDDVLSGRRGLREASADPAYRRVVDAGVAEFAQQWNALSDEEKAELERQGEADLAQLREQIRAEQGDAAADDDYFTDPLRRRDRPD